MSVIFLGSLSALGWGAAGYVGGQASKKATGFQVVMVARFLSMLIIPVIALVIGEAMISPLECLFCVFSGVFGFLGTAILYAAFAEGDVSIKSAAAAVTGACVPVIVAIFIEGFPGMMVLLAILISLVSVWLVSQDQQKEQKGALKLKTLSKALIAGFCFGIMFVAMNLASSEAIFWPTAVAHTAAFLFAFGFMKVKKLPILPDRSAMPLIILQFVLELTGLIFYILAGQTGRMDVAAVLSSMYSGVTILLAWLLLKERLNRTQWTGVALALAAIVLFSV